MENFDYSIAMDYFNSRPGVTRICYILILISVISFIIYFKNVGEYDYSFGFFCFQFLPLIGGIFGLYKISKKTTLATLKEEIKELEEEIMSKAVNTLGIDIDQCNEIDPVLIQSFDYYTKYNQCLYNSSDNIPSAYRFTILFFSEEQVYYYDHSFSLISREENVITGEYFYRDIVSFNTGNETLVYQVKDERYTKTCQKFNFATTGGTTLSCIIDTSDINKIQGMRQLLREKKRVMV